MTNQPEPTAPHFITVLMIDDHPVVRAGLRAVLESHDGIRVVGDAATGEAGIELAAALNPAVVLCDLRLGDGIDGVETTARLRALPAPPAVLILTTYGRDAEILGAIEAGAAGYLMKDLDPAEIVTALRQAARGQIVLAPEIATRMVTSLRNPRARLTDREQDVLRHLATGASNREMAKALFVSEATIKSHLVHIFEKLGVDNRSRAVHAAREAGLL